MIIPIVGIPVSGKSSLLKSVMDSLGEPERIKFGKDYKCTQFNDILVLGYYEEETFSGTDSWRYSTIATGLFEEFIFAQIKNYRHIIFEGDRLTSKVRFLVENFNTTVFMLTVDQEQERIRQDARGNKQNPRWIKSRHSQMKNLHAHDSIKPHLLVRENNSAEQARTIHTEIIDLLRQQKPLAL